MKWLTVVALSICIVVSSAAGPLGAHLRLSHDEYLRASWDRAMPSTTDENWSLRFWIRLDGRPPLPLQQRVVMARPGSWALVLRGDVHRLQPMIKGDVPLAPMLVAYLERVTYDGRGSATTSDLTIIPYQEWTPVSIDFTLAGVGGSFGHGMRRLDDLIAITVRGAWRGDASAPLYVGGGPGDLWQRTKPESFPPYPHVAPTVVELDDLHFSSKPRGEAKIRPRTKPDADTVALWDFEEGEDAAYYESEGAIRYRIRKETLTVQDVGKVTTTWGRLRKGARR